MLRSASLLAGAALVLGLSGCPDDPFLSDNDLEDMVCDGTGCWHCDGGVCGEYRCDFTHQCPKGRVCSADQRCLLGDDSSGNTGSTNSGDFCTAHEDCPAGAICTLDGSCVDSPGSGGSGTATDTANTSNGDAGTAGDGSATNGDGGGDGSGTVGLPDHPDDACTHNKDCGDGICLNGGCYFDCYSDDTCAPGQVCTEGQCLPSDVPENTCTFNGECGPDKVCVEGTCYETCGETFECLEHTKCAGGICVADTTPVIQCSGPNSCDGGQGCVDGKCLDSCGEGDCGDGAECKFGFCHQTVSCFDQAECDGNDCLDGVCQ